eukprot:TRINITY_DN36754_c0_g1_i1.p1 TRINITY_DN36754_c0_g1~~TRINITY_DN36754_c0_g1_i1.p1  ORF type:complete len:332 (+),score=82.94 TRINITY_DN36754_c0_g1_i1:67-1062(+)
MGMLYNWTLAVCVWVSFTVFGWATEALTGTEYGENKEKFSATWFLVLMQSAGNSLVALTILCLTGHGRNVSAGVSARHWLVVAVSYLGAHKFGLLSLMYIIYPLQVLVKSCKSVPVMLGEVFFGTAQLTVAKVVNVIVLCSGVVVFSMGKDFKSVKSGTNEEITLDAKTATGLSLAGLALVCDGIYGPYQSKIVQDVRSQGRVLSSYHLMFNMNLYQGLFALVGALATNELSEVYGFVTRNPSVLRDLGFFSLAMAVGNIFIFTMQRDLGSLTVTKTTTVRKIISILFSVYYFGHSIHPGQWVGVLLVFLSEPLKVVVDRNFPSKPKVKAQ